MVELTKPDVQWLLTLLTLVQDVYWDYPELFSEEDEDVIRIAGELIRSLGK